MHAVHLTCPACGFSRQIPASRVPAGAKTACCPDCGHRFPVDFNLIESRVTRQPTSCRTLGQLFDEAWRIFRSRWKTLVPLFILVYLAVLVPVGLGLACGLMAGTWWPELENVLPVAGALIGMLFGMAVMFWVYAALIMATINEAMTLGKALRNSTSLLWPYLWTLSLVSVLITGGMFLLLLPGLVMTVWFFFVPFILADQRINGLKALQLSQQLVIGHFWELCGKFLIATLVPSALGAVPVVGPVLSLLAVPFVLIMVSLIYEDQKERLETAAMPRKNLFRTLLWWGMALAGYLMVTLLAYWVLSHTEFSWHSSWHFISCITGNDLQL